MTAKQAIFVREYLLDRNATRAATVAGYSAKTAYVQGYNLLRTPEIKAAIEQVGAITLKRNEVTADRIVQEYSRIAFLDPGKLFDNNGHMKPISSLDEDTRRAVASVSVDGNKVKTVKTVSKTQALEALGRHTGFFPSEKQQIQVGLGLEIHMHLDEIK